MEERESERSRRFDELFASYSSDIVAYCGWRAGSASDAQDAVAEVFLTAWRRLDELPDGIAPRWPAWYEREEARIRSLLGDRVVRVAHTGSTSVPGLAAKPIIDSTLEVPDSAAEHAYAPDLEAAGYVLRIRERVGYMPESDCLPMDVTAADFVGHMAEMSGLPGRAARQRANDVLYQVGVDEER